MVKKTHESGIRKARRIFHTFKWSAAVGTRNNFDGVVRKDTFERKAEGKFRQKVGFIQANSKPVSLNNGDSSYPLNIFPF
jgi:hypothetical protein